MPHAYPNRPKRRSNALLPTLVGVSALWLVPLLSHGADANPFVTINTLTMPDGRLIQETIIDGPPTPPPGFAIQRQSVSLPEPNMAAGINMMTVPAFNWVFGCSAVSGAMIAAYYDRSGWPDMYTGPTNGGVMPLNNSGWPTWTDTGGSIYPSCPLIASKNGIDGRVVRGSIDDYWVQYGSGANDPYIPGGWAQHDWGSAIGDYMKTSQSAFANTDGSTAFYNWTSSPTPLTCGDMEYYAVDHHDGTYGRKLFYEARGYTVTDCYNQNTDNNGGGFTFAMYQAEIDAGRPVMLNLAGHTIVGTGYDSATNTIYIHDTWDYSTHTMPWGGSYAGLDLLSVSIVNLSPCVRTVSGNLFYDYTQLSDNTVDGLDYLPPGINAVLVQVNLDLSQVVVDSAAIPERGQPNVGQYSFAASCGETYYVMLANTGSFNVGDAPPANSSLPGGYVNVGENIGAGEGSDGTVNGKSAVFQATTDNVVEVNFGIIRFRPISLD